MIPSPAGLALAAGGLLVSTLLAALLQGPFGVTDAAIVYLLAVVAVGFGYGSWYAVGTAVASFLVYDFLFVKPLYTFAVGSAEEWLDLLLFLVVAIAIGRLSALQLQRRREAELRSSEARAMFAMSRDVATAATALEAAPQLAVRLAREAQMARVWIGLGASIGDERVVADSDPTVPRPPLTSRWILHSSGSDTQPSWALVRDVAPAGRASGGSRRLGTDSADAPVVLRVPIAVGTEAIGSLWATRRADDPFPGRSHSRLMAAAADQLGQAVVRDRLAAEATAAEVARQGDALKSALLDSVSHDLRTPLSAIRAAAGNLMDPDVVLTPDARQSAARSIDREADRLSRLVRNMLDLGRIEGGALEPSLELYELADLVEPVLERLIPAIEPAKVEVDIPADLPAVRVDAVFIDQILTNLVDNAARYAAGRAIRVSARSLGEFVGLVVEDGGPGVPASELSHIFERFYRLPGRQGSRAAGGSGIGLAVVRGFAQAMGGSILARRSTLGGLAVVVRLPVEKALEPRVDGDGMPDAEAAPPAIEVAEAEEVAPETTPAVDHPPADVGPAQPRPAEPAPAVEAIGAADASNSPES
jgi:two-component system, OmpR family, sensor histidine kinase KdpD